jgi:release factor glutamine methyltransferase
MHTIDQALQAARKRIEPVSSSSSLDAQVLLAEILGANRAYLLAHGDEALTSKQHDRYCTFVERCAAGEPVAYILGRRAFYDRDIIVSPAVLIPRPETELLLEAVLAAVEKQPQVIAVDVGTGSGALAVTLAAHCPQATVYATDSSPPALDIARKNAARHNVNVIFMQGDLLQPLIQRNIRIDILMANLPYIASDALPALAVSRYEPLAALDGGPDGLVVIRRLLEQAPTVCQPGTQVLLEIGADQGDAVRKLVVGSLSPRRVDVRKDYAGHDRIVHAVC